MKRAFFVLLVVLISRVTLEASASSSGLGIGNFFLQPGNTSASNLNEVLSLVMGSAGPQGAPGANGLPGANGAPGKDGANGINGVNGINGTNGLPGTSGAQGVSGPQGPAGPQGPQGPAGAAGTSGGGGYAGVGSGVFSLNTCDDTVGINLNQVFMGTYFKLNSVIVNQIAGATGSSRGCAGQYATLHFLVSTIPSACTVQLSSGITGTDNQVTFDRSNCTTIANGIHMNDLDSNLGFEITAQGGA